MKEGECGLQLHQFMVLISLWFLSIDTTFRLGRAKRCDLFLVNEHQLIAVYSLILRSVAVSNVPHVTTMSPLIFTRSLIRKAYLLNWFRSRGGNGCLHYGTTALWPLWMSINRRRERCFGHKSTCYSSCCIISKHFLVHVCGVFRNTGLIVLQEYYMGLIDVRDTSALHN